jgi:hypothetical protein
MSPALLDAKPVLLDRRSRSERRRGAKISRPLTRRFNIGKGTPEPARVTHSQGGKQLITGAETPHIPPSRTMELVTDREVDRFIRAVQKRRSELADHDRYLRRLRKPGLFGPMPRLAGGSGPMAAQAQGQGPDSNAATASVEVVPFDQASKRGIEQGPSYVVTPGAAPTTLGPVPLPAQGYLRQVEIDIKTTTAATGAPVAREDYPSSIIQLARFQDTNGNQLDDLPGFALLEDNIFGGYAGSPDPRVDPEYSASATVPSIQLQLVRELAPNGFGAIANMSASQAYKLTLRIASLTEMYSTAPTAAPTFLISTWMHFWQQPDDFDLLGRQQVTSPPFHGTTQYRWYAPANSVTQNFNLTLTQTGNEIRNIILIARNNAGTRTNAMFPEPFQFRWDTELLLISGLRQLKKIARELTNDLTAVDNGVLPLPFNFGEGRTVGGSGLNSWLPTVTSSRLQITGAQPASEPGTCDVYTNDVSMAETNPALRPVVPGPGGYTPQVAPRMAGAQ